MYEALDSQWRGDRLLEARVYCVLPSACIRVEGIFPFGPNSVSASFIQLRWAEKNKILAVTVAANP